MKQRIIFGYTAIRQSTDWQRAVTITGWTSGTGAIGRAY